MCRNVGYIGQSDAFPILVVGLKKLDYRECDSTGVALEANDKKLKV